MPISRTFRHVVHAATLSPFFALALPLAGHAQLLTVAPQAAGNAQSPTPFNYYGSGGSRTQQVYDAGLFSNFGGPRSISEFDFRTYPGASPNGFIGNTVSISNVQITLSTTQKGDELGNTLSTSYANNIGSDVKTVYSGALTLTTLSPGSFDYSVVLQNGFVYDPTMGNLLLDVTIPTGAVVSGPGFGFLTFDTVNTFNDGIYSIVDINSGSDASGTASTAGAITRFVSSPVATPVPEPASLAILGIGLAGLGFMRRQKRV